MTRLLCLRLHAKPSGATLDIAHGETGHPFRAASGSSVKGAKADTANTHRLVPKAPPLAGPGQQPWPYFPSRLARAENGHEVYRAKQAERAPTLRYRTPADRRSRVQRWLDAVSELQELQGDYQGWLDALPESMADGATADALRAICDLDLSELQSIVPPKGFGRD